MSRMCPFQPLLLAWPPKPKNKHDGFLSRLPDSFCCLRVPQRRLTRQHISTLTSTPTPTSNYSCLLVAFNYDQSYKNFTSTLTIHLIRPQTLQNGDQPSNVGRTNPQFSHATDSNMNAQYQPGYHPRDDAGVQENPARGSQCPKHRSRSLRAV